MSRVILIAALVAPMALAACGGGGGSRYSEEGAPPQPKEYVYNPNARHAPVSLSGNDLQGIRKDTF